MSIIINKQIVASAGSDNADSMSSLIYDPYNKQTDIYDYADSRNFIIKIGDPNSGVNIGYSYEEKSINKIITPEKLSLEDLYNEINDNKNIILELICAPMGDFGIEHRLNLTYYSMDEYGGNGGVGFKFSNDYFEAEMITDDYIYIWEKERPLFGSHNEDPESHADIRQAINNITPLIVTATDDIADKTFLEMLEVYENGGLVLLNYNDETHVLNGFGTNQMQHSVGNGIYEIRYSWIAMFTSIMSSQITSIKIEGQSYRASKEDAKNVYGKISTITNTLITSGGGGRVTGYLYSSKTPTMDDQVTNKLYVDNSIAAAIGTAMEAIY